MPGRGILFALSEMEDCLFRELRSPEAIGAFLALVRERIKKPWSQAVDKGWEPVHRCLTDGCLHYGRSPLYRCILGTKNYRGEGNWHFVNYKSPEQVKQVSAELNRYTHKRK
jgi:hypothetical protein